MAVAAGGAAVRGEFGRIGHFLLHEFREMLPPTLFFLVGFSIILLTRRLVLEQYLIEVTGFTLAAGGALIVGKAVLVADTLPFLRRFDNAPLIQPILFKTLVYTVVVFFARLVEEFVRYLIEGGALGGFTRHILEQFSWQRFAAAQIWIAVLFLIYTTASELNTLFGDGELFKVLFTRRSSEAKLTRRQRVRELVRIGRLLDAHPVEAFRGADPALRGELETHLRRLSHRQS
jgi:hypothetical protein